jgi:hypothetical protein
MLNDIINLSFQGSIHFGLFQCCDRCICWPVYLILMTNVGLFLIFDPKDKLVDH